jgi:ethanolamine utilization protein EutN
MQLACVLGQGIATVKHPSLKGWRLLLVQPLAADGSEDGEPLLAVDNLGAGFGATVILSNDGAGARELIGSPNTPARWTVLGICDSCRSMEAGA